MDFGITLKSDLDIRREVKLAQQAESAGFGYVWTFDSHVLWQECYTRMALWGYTTDKVHIGTLVTNPIVRDITVTASGFATLQKFPMGAWISVSGAAIPRGASLAKSRPRTIT